MKLLYKSLIAIIVPVSIWMSIPFGLVKYINYKYPNINVSNVSVVGIDCIKLNNVKVSKPNISGTVYSAVVCYRNKTININGGNLNFVLEKTSGKSDTNGFEITANNLDIHLIKDEISADFSKAKINREQICSEKVIASHKKADATIYGLCIDRKENSITATSGIIHPKIEFKGYKINDVFFKNISHASRTHIAIGEIKYEETTASNVIINKKDEFASVDIGSVSIYHKRLFALPITLQNINVSNINIKEPLSSNLAVAIGSKIRFSVNIGEKKINGNGECQDWLDIVPVELKAGPIEQMKLKGSFSFNVQFEPVSLKINSKCTIDGPTPKFIKDLSKPFIYTAYHPDGTKFDRTSGPGTQDWIPLDFIDNMATALTITEDPGFWYHKGIIPQALENSLKDDIKRGKFFRGGSTITMQLAKNLWLTRNKSIGRKLQESILTIALESGLTKEKILELYLNVVEFGPNIYGIGPGCAKLLRKYPGEITLSEALYMAIRLPSPNKAHSYESSKGFIDKLISIGISSGKISEEELMVELEKTNEVIIEEDDM